MDDDERCNQKESVQKNLNVQQRFTPMIYFRHLTLRQVTHPSSFSNCEMSTLSILYPRPASISWDLGADDAMRRV
jgi:hypothetical protein